MAKSAIAASSQTAKTTSRCRTENRAAAYRILVVCAPFLRYSAARRDRTLNELRCKPARTNPELAQQDVQDDHHEAKERSERDLSHQFSPRQLGSDRRAHLHEDDDRGGCVYPRVHG